MRYIIQIFGVLIIIILISCAKQSTPMGGPQDEDPPKLLSITPSNESLNVKPTSIELVFDEYIKTETPNKQIIITPRINKDEMEVTTNKNRVIIDLNQDLEDSTTYVFNFQKSIKDITENNSPENLRLVFSTGPQIDSLTVSGNVSFILPQRDKNITDVLVGLYTLEDTTNVLTAAPYYIGQTDSVGNFELTNIKAGDYKAYAWHDQNNSLKAEEKQEAYGFFSETLHVSENITEAQFYLSKADLSDFKITRTGVSGQSFDIVISKYPVTVKLDHKDLNKTLFFRQNEKTIRLYHTTLRNDSIPVGITLTDSVGFKLDTLIYSKFETSERKNEKLEPTLTGKKNFISTISADIKFNKPISEINYDSLMVKYDSASVLFLRPDMTSFKDSSDRTLLTLHIPISDSLKQEIFNLVAMDSTFKDIEGEYNEKKIEASYKKLNKETLAEEIKVKVNTDVLPIIVQIQDKKEEIFAEQYLTKTNIGTFQNIEPGTYIIRAILDINQNKVWDTSNMIQNRQAEPIYYLENSENENPRDTIIRGGWSLEVIIEPNKPAGLPKKQEKLPQ